VQHLLGAHVLAGLTPANTAALAGRSFFPRLIAGPFHAGLTKAFGFAIAACLIASLASWSRGRRVPAAQRRPAARAAPQRDAR
jgi:hypothetical protein